MAVVYQIACHASRIHHQMHSVSCRTQLPFHSIKLTRFFMKLHCTLHTTIIIVIHTLHREIQIELELTFDLFFRAVVEWGIWVISLKNTLQTGFEWKKLLYGTSSNILTPKKAGKKVVIVVDLKNKIYHCQKSWTFRARDQLSAESHF